MRMTQGDNGGGGSTTNVCAITPGHQTGSIDNILTRLTTLETIVSQLLGVDISTIQLSDISQDMGTILGGHLASGALANMITAIRKSNVWMWSLGDNVINGDGSGNDFGMG